MMMYMRVYIVASVILFSCIIDESIAQNCGTPIECYEQSLANLLKAREELEDYKKSQEQRINELESNLKNLSEVKFDQFKNLSEVKFDQLKEAILLLEQEKACPDKSALDNYGFCIWHEPENKKVSFRGAAKLCQSKGARLCTVAEISAAQAAGAEWCSAGWSADRDPSNADKATISYPMQAKKKGCGETLLYIEFQDLDRPWGANCCKQ